MALLGRNDGASLHQLSETGAFGLAEGAVVLSHLLLGLGGEVGIIHQRVSRLLEAIEALVLAVVPGEPLLEAGLDPLAGAAHGLGDHEGNT